MEKDGVTDLKLRNRNLIFSIAKTKECLGEVYKVINKVYRQEGFILEDEEDMFPDKYYEFSTIFYAMNKNSGRIVAGLRSVNDVIGLPLEEVFDISNIKSEIISRGGRYVEGGTRVADPRPNPNASFGMMAIWHQYLVKENISDSLVSIRPFDRKFFEKLGFRVIGEKKFYEKVHRDAYLMHAETEKWLQPYRDAFLQADDNIILDI